MGRPKKVIIITDGDEYAKKTMDYLSQQLGGTCLAYLSDNPTHASEKQVTEAIMAAPEEPVYVLIDDAGAPGPGAGEKILLGLAKNENIQIMGAIAVAAHTKNAEWTRFTLAIDQDGQLTSNGISKEGIPIPEIGRINGDTIYSLDQVDIPVVVAIGDIGKMQGKDDIKKGSPITRKAIEIILERGGYQ
ncbi:stage V sporulation protein AE [Sediminibacillus halophilus]|uniref:Stage V sporulation protein AE n=1 Tax=Sediminibacillus halophilus TaxID=482461 RepID=A0A1G9LS79_9BACI|nr:stage V sporulation protein AE [Sediminibacillus halophilus]SDL64637.1 stage V sporulation protein AE [Sediminibacillus halophilus]